MVATIVVLSTLVGGVPRFWSLAARDFWFDEACTYIYVKNLFDWQGGRSLLVESTNLPYYILLKGWVSVFGNSEACYRSLSAIAATLTIPLLALIAIRLGGFRAFIVTTLIAAFHPLHIYYASEARAYALWVMLLTLCLLMLIESARRGLWRWWAGYAATVLAAIFTHYFTLFWIPATVCALLIASNPRRVFVQWACATSVILLVFFPYFLLAVLPAAGGGQAWIADHFAPIGALLQTIWAFMPAGHYPAHLRGLSLDAPDTTQASYTPIAWFAAVAPILTVIAIGLLLLRRRATERNDDTRIAKSQRMGQEVMPNSGTDKSAFSCGVVSFRVNLIVLLGLTFVPLLIALGYSVTVRPIYLPGRYDLVAWPGFILLTSLIVAQVPEVAGLRRFGPSIRNGIGCGVVLLLLGCSTIIIVQYARFRPPPTVHHRRANVLVDAAQLGDLVVAFNYDRAGMLYYLERAKFRGTIISFPSWLDDQIGWADNGADLSPMRADAAAKDAIAIAEQMRKAIDGKHRVFMLVDTVDPQRKGVRVPLDDLLLTSALTHGLTPSVFDEELLIFEWKFAAPVEGIGN